MSAALGALAVGFQVWSSLEESIRAALWVLLFACAIAVVWGGRLDLVLAEPRMSLPLPAVVLAGVVGVGVRLWLAAAFHGNFDQNSFETTASTLARGGNIYATGVYNYSPLWAHVLLVLRSVAQGLGLPFHAAVRGFLTVVDVANAWLIFRVVRQRSPIAARWSCAAYLLNPVAILVVGYHGQFETLAALPLLASAAFMRRFRRASLAFLWPLVTFSLLVKQSLAPIGFALLVWAAPGALTAIALGAGSAAVFLLSLLPYWMRDSTSVTKNVLFYAGTQQDSGTALVLARPWALPAFGALMFALAWVGARRVRLAPGELLAVLGVAFVALSPSVAEQQFIVPALLGGAVLGLWYPLFSLCASGFMLASGHYPELLPPVVPRDAVWLCASGWLISLLLPWPWLATVPANLPNRTEGRVA